MIRHVFPLAVALFCLAADAPAQRQIAFQFDRPAPGVAVPRYNFDLREDGQGSYHAEPAPTAGAEPQPIDKPLRFAPQTVRTAFEAVATLRASDTPCAAKMKNIADTGNKTLTLRGPEGETVCGFNYTENKGASQLADLFQGIELTLEAGRALDFKRRFDRLGLDAEMSNLGKAADEGRARALEVIAPTLRSIAADTELIERVRVRAGKLLERIDKAS